MNTYNTADRAAKGLGWPASEGADAPRFDPLGAEGVRVFEAKWADGEPTTYQITNSNGFVLAQSRQAADLAPWLAGYLAELDRLATAGEPEHFVRRDPECPNLIDGSVFATDVRANGAYVTVAGNGEMPLILSFDLDDIRALKLLLNEFGG